MELGDPSPTLGLARETQSEADVRHIANGVRRVRDIDTGRRYARLITPEVTGSNLQDILIDFMYTALGSLSCRA